ncbi:oligosaccharide flippase family protein [Aeromicrobium sp.]|uniref:lipopolysaccharide biosynthesis protein n=1 Tax=Aeromicrobium sp. TaxID=1871063 RepID=UPI0030C33D79
MSEAYEPPRAPKQMRDRFSFLLIVGVTFGLQFLTLITGVIIARLLGVEGRGIIALVLALGMFASQLTFGASLPNALAKALAERQIAARDGFGRIARRRGVLLVLPCLTAAAFMLFLQRSGAGPQKYLLAAAVFVMALQTMLFRILAGGLQGEGRLVRMALAGLAPQLLFTVVLTTAALQRWDWQALDVLLAYFVTGTLGLAFAFSSLLRPSRRAEDQLDETPLWAESRRMYVSSVRPLDGLALDRIAVGGLLGTAPLGLYTAALAVSNLCSLVSNAVAVIVLPRVAMHGADRTAQRAVIRRWVSLSAGLIVLLVVVLQILVDPIIRTAFGEEFAGGIECARWLIVADGLMALRKVLIAVLQGEGRGGTASWIELTLLPMMMAGIAVAAAQESLPGIGMSLAAVGALSCLSLGWVVGRRDAVPRAGQGIPAP